MSWERTKARISHPAGLCVLALFLVFLYVELTQEGGASSSFMLSLACQSGVDHLGRCG